MRYLHIVAIKYGDDLGDIEIEWTGVVRDAVYLSREDSWGVAREYLSRHYIANDIIEVYAGSVTEVDGHKIKVVCKPQERSEQ